MVLFLIIHVIVSTVVVGIAFTVAMIAGYESVSYLAYSMGGAALLALPISYLITQHLRKQTR